MARGFTFLLACCPCTVPAVVGLVQERRFSDLMDKEMRERAKKEEEMESRRALLAIEAREKAVRERQEARQIREADLK